MTAAWEELRKEVALWPISNQESFVEQTIDHAKEISKVVAVIPPVHQRHFSKGRIEDPQQIQQAVRERLRDLPLWERLTLEEQNCQQILLMDNITLVINDGFNSDRDFEKKLLAGLDPRLRFSSFSKAVLSLLSRLGACTSSSQISSREGTKIRSTGARHRSGGYRNPKENG